MGSIIALDAGPSSVILMERHPSQSIHFYGSIMAKVFTIPVPPTMPRRSRERKSDPRYVDGQKMLVEAMRYLAQADPIANRHAIELLSEHVRTRFRMTDSPLN
jgi:hypothetical protein